MDRVQCTHMVNDKGELRQCKNRVVKGQTRFCHIHKEDAPRYQWVIRDSDPTSYATSITSDSREISEETNTVSGEESEDYTSDDGSSDSGVPVVPTRPKTSIFKPKDSFEDMIFDSFQRGNRPDGYFHSSLCMKILDEIPLDLIKDEEIIQKMYLTIDRSGDRQYILGKVDQNEGICRYLQWASNGTATAIVSKYPQCIQYFLYSKIPRTLSDSIKKTHPEIYKLYPNSFYPESSNG